MHTSVVIGDTLFSIHELKAVRRSLRNARMKRLKRDPVSPRKMANQYRKLCDSFNKPICQDGCFGALFYKRYAY